MDPMNNTGLPPPAPQKNGAAPSGMDEDLYAQIAGQDDVLVTKKKSKSPFILVMAQIMRFIMYLDSLKYTYERTFRALGTLWGILMAAIYFSGVLVLFFGVYNRMQLPLFLEEQMRTRNVQFSSATYTMDSIRVYDLTDAQGKYKIDTLIIYSTFTDLLQKRFRGVIMDGVTIQTESNVADNVVDRLSFLLSGLENPTKNQMDLTVNSFTVNNGKLIFKDEQMEMPVSFSMEAVYKDKTQIVIPLSVTRENLKIKAMLSLEQAGRDSKWVFSVTEGSLALPRSAPENIKGDFKLTLNNGKLSDVQADFKMGYGTIEKNIKASFNTNDQGGFFGKVAWNKNNVTEPQFASNLAFTIENLKLLSFREFVINGNLLVESKGIQTQEFGLSQLQAPLKTDIACKDFSRCLMKITQDSPVDIYDLRFVLQNQVVQSSFPVQFVLKPTEKALSLEKENPYLSFDLQLENLSFEGKQENNEEMKITLNNLTLNGALNDTSSMNKLAVKADNLSYQTPSVSFKNAYLEIDNVFQGSSRMYFTTQETKLANVMPLFAHPFNLNLNMVGNQASAQLMFKNTPLSLKLNGQLSLSARTFAGQIEVPPFNLKELTVPVQKLWPNVPSALTNPSGEITLKGQLVFSGTHNVSGPLYIGFKDVSFDVENRKVRGLNTVLSVETLVPFTTQSSQHLFVKSVQNILPFQNMDMIFQMDEQSFHLNQVSVIGAGVPLSLPPSILSLKTPNGLLYLKNEAPLTHETMTAMMNLKDVEVLSGTGALTIPVQIEQGTVALPNATLKFQNALVKRHQNAFEDVFANADSYYIRTGQVIMDKNRLLQLAFNGRLMPSKAPKAYQKNNVVLPDNFFKMMPDKAVPADIQKAQKALFGN